MNDLIAGLQYLNFLQGDLTIESDGYQILVQAPDSYTNGDIIYLKSKQFILKDDTFCYILV